MEAYVIHVKGFNKDANGCEKVIYATASQVENIANLRDDPKTAGSFVEMGNFLFSPKDIAYIERKVKKDYDLPSYFKDKAAEEKTRGLPTGGLDARVL